jgi:ChrR Cupin-like domain
MKYEKLCELAAMHALDLLDEADVSALEEVALEFTELEAELIEFRNTVSAFAYSACNMPMVPDLKERLFERIANDTHSTSIFELQQKASKVMWEPYPLPGVMLGKLYIDNDKREIACFVRADGAVKFPTHKHAGDEEIVVLQGDLMIDGQVYESGARIFSQPNTIHQPETQNGCLLFLHTSLDDEILG